MVALLAAFVSGQWFATRVGSLLQFNYGTVANAPQYGVLDLSSSYLRLNYGPGSGWGTSIDTMPCYWSGNKLFQGFPVTASVSTSGNNLVLTVDGTSNTLSVHETITVAPPSGTSILATVSATTSGTVSLDNRPGEAFKPVFLSSMHESNTSWDSLEPFVGTQTFGFPGGGWIISPSPQVKGNSFGLLGGTSSWKVNAPSVTILCPTLQQVAGWLTTDSNPNDDNVGLWAATTFVPASWSYQILAEKRHFIPVLPGPISPSPGKLGG